MAARLTGRYSGSTGVYRQRWHPSPRRFPFQPSAPAALLILSGTVTSSITETDIVAGGKTIILTLTATTWNED